MQPRKLNIQTHGLLQALGNPARHGLQCRNKSGAVFTTTLSQIRTATTLASGQTSNVGQQFPGLDPACGSSIHPCDQRSLAVAGARQNDNRVDQLLFQAVHGIAQGFGIKAFQAGSQYLDPRHFNRCLCQVGSSTGSSLGLEGFQLTLQLFLTLGQLPNLVDQLTRAATQQCRRFHGGAERKFRRG